MNDNELIMQYSSDIPDDLEWWEMVEEARRLDKERAEELLDSYYDTQGQEEW